MTVQGRERIILFFGYGSEEERMKTNKQDAEPGTTVAAIESAYLESHDIVPSGPEADRLRVVAAHIAAAQAAQEAWCQNSDRFERDTMNQLAPEELSRWQRAHLGACLTVVDEQLAVAQRELDELEAEAASMREQAHPPRSSPTMGTTPEQLVALAIWSRRRDEFVARFRLTASQARGDAMEAALDEAMRRGDLDLASVIVDSAVAVLAERPTEQARLLFERLETRLADARRPANWMELEKRAAGLHKAVTQLRQRCLDQLSAQRDGLIQRLADSAGDEGNVPDRACLAHLIAEGRNHESFKALQLVVDQVLRELEVSRTTGKETQRASGNLRILKRKQMPRKSGLDADL